MGWGSAPARSTVPAALDALIAMAARALPEVQVTDGAPVGDVADDVVAIGTTGRPGEVAVEESRTEARLAGRDGEAYDVSCVASSWRGAETDFKPVRDALFGMLDALAAEIAVDRTLGGAVAHASMRVVTYFQDQTGAADDEGTPSGSGAVATAQFIVHVEAFTG